MRRMLSRPADAGGQGEDAVARRRDPILGLGQPASEQDARRVAKRALSRTSSRSRACTGPH